MNIPQVKLLKGSHAETKQTGQGCFMNVVAYLNNEPTITDQSECVCFVMRPLFVWVNDWMTDDERPQLLPFILRAMASRTNDKIAVSRRLALVVAFANKMAEYAAKYAIHAAKYAEYAAKYAAESAAKYAAKYAAEPAAMYAAKYAIHAAKSAIHAAKYAEYAAMYAEYAAMYAEYDAMYAARRKQIIAALLALFDAALPPLERIDEQTVQRIRHLESLGA